MLLVTETNHGLAYDRVVKVSFRTFYDVIFVAMVKTNGEMAKAVENIVIASDPSHVIIHSGTNNLPAESADSFVADI